jgi:Holliday junction DNA helicase RuvA
MIGSLRGTLLDRAPGEVLVEVGGVGYRVTVTPSTSVDLGHLGDDVFVHVHHHVREDAQTLYGFATRDERVAFEALIGAHGVGPSLALAILSVHSPAQLRAALAADDVAALCLVPGVGKKTAARLLVELKSRLDLGEVVDLTAVTGNGNGATSAAPNALADVRDALAGLGYGPDEIRDVLADLPPEGDAGELVRMALKRLAVRA